MADDPPSVRRDSLISDVLEQHPQAARILFEEFGLPCYECEVAFTHSIEDGVALTGHDPDVVVARLNGRPRDAEGEPAAK